MQEPVAVPAVPHDHQRLVVGCILLLLAEERSHGYGLQERVKRLMPQWELSVGSLYRELRSLDAEGLVASVWEPSQTRGPARRVYEITDAGRKALDQWVVGIAGLIEMLDRCIAQHETLPPPPPRPRPRTGARTRRS